MNSMLRKIALLLFCSLVGLPAFAQINPKTDINWPNIVGSGAPDSSACSSLNYGQPYWDGTNHLGYTCDSSGWVADNSGSSGVAQLLAGTNVSLSPSNGLGTVTINASGGSLIPSNATFVFTGNSVNQDDPTEVLSSPITVTAYSAPSSGIVTVTNSGTNGLSAGDWVATYSMSWSPSLPSGVGGGTGYTLFQVLSSGLSETQFEINVGSLSGISACSSSCGSAYSAMHWYPFLTVNSAGFPAGANAATTVLLAIDSSSDVTYKGLAANFTTLFTSISPSVTGKPGYVIVNDFENDIGFCETVSAIEGYITSIMSQAHTLGYTVVFGTEAAKNVSPAYGAGFCTYPAPPTSEQIDLNQWLLTMGKTAANEPTGEYWDILLPLGAALNDGYNSNVVRPDNNTFEPTGAIVAANLTANALLTGNGGPLPIYQSYFGQANSTANATFNGYVYWPSADGIQTYQWLNNDKSLAMSLGTGVYAGLTLDSNWPNAINDSSGMDNGSILGITETGGDSEHVNILPMTTVFAPNQTAPATPFWEWGINNSSAANNIELQMTYAGSGSTSNYGTLAMNGSTGIKFDAASHVYIPGITTTASTSPICPDGTGGALTTTGCAGAAAIFSTDNPNGSNTWSYVQSGSGTGNGVSVTLSSPVAATDVILVFYSSSGGAKSVGDSLGTTFTSLHSASTLYYGEVYCGVLPSSGSDTVYVGGGAGNNQVAIVYEFSGGSCATDSVGTGVTNSSSIALSNTTTVANDLLFSPLLDDDSSSSASTIGTPWTANGVVHGNQNINTAYQAATAAGAYSGTWTVATSSYAYILSIEPAPAASGVEGQIYYQTSTTPYTVYVYNGGTWQLASPETTSGLSGMTSGQVPIAATASTVTSSMPVAGSGSGVTTGPTSTTSGDCAEFTGTGGQIADAGSPCGSGGGSTVTAAPPYIEIGSTLYIPTDSMYEATLPTGFSSGCAFSSTWSWVNAVTPTTCITGANGNQLLKTTSTSIAWAEKSATTSVEAVFSLINTASTGANSYPLVGIWLYDSTNSKIYVLSLGSNSSTTATSINNIYCQIYTYSGTGSPLYSSNILVANSGGYGFPAHLKLVSSGGTLTFEYSLDGGSTYITLTTESVGTIADGGYLVEGTASGTTAMDLLSVVTN